MPGIFLAAESFRVILAGTAIRHPGPEAWLRNGNRATIGEARHFHASSDAAPSSETAYSTSLNLVPRNLVPRHERGRTNGDSSNTAWERAATTRQPDANSANAWHHGRKEGVRDHSRIGGIEDNVSSCCSSEIGPLVHRIEDDWRGVSVFRGE